MGRRKRLDQDIYFTIEGIKCRLYLDTTYSGSSDRFLINPEEPNELPAKLDFSVISQKLYEKLIPKGTYFWPRATDNYLEISVDIEDGSIGITQGIFVSLTDWDGSNFDFTGAAGFIELLNDLKEVEPEIKFLRGDGEKIEVPAKIPW